MIIWGTSSTKIKQALPVEGLCSARRCKEFILHGIQYYGHIWWIPLFPWSKTFFLTCLQCESSISNYRVDNLVQGIDKSIFKTPKLSYAALFIILFLFLMMLLVGISNEEQVEQPKNYAIKYTYDTVKANDFLILHDTKDFGYILAKVLKVNGDDITFRFSKSVYRKQSYLLSLAKTGAVIFEDNFYQDDYYEASIKELQKELPLNVVVSRTDNPQVK